MGKEREREPRQFVTSREKQRNMIRISWSTRGLLLMVGCMINQLTHNLQQEKERPCFHCHGSTMLRKLRWAAKLHIEVKELCITD
jgi:hypothetical protein